MTAHPTLFRVPPEAINVYWPEVERLLNEYPETWNIGQTLDTIQQLLLLGNLHLWVLQDSRSDIYLMAFTEWRVFPNCRGLCCVWMAGQKLTDYLQLVMSGMEEFARAYDATITMIEGRPGFQKIFANQGYRPLSTTIIKELNKGQIN